MPDRTTKRKVTFDITGNEPTGEVKDFLYLIGTIHRDDEDFMIYKVMDVYVNKSTGFIVGDRAMVLKDGSLYDKTEYDPIHVKDLARMTKDYQLDKNQTLRCNL